MHLEVVFFCPECLSGWEVSLWLFLKVLFTQKCIKIIYFFIFLKLFLISVHQNDLKTQKKILI
jgi:hypothetical protein